MGDKGIRATVLNTLLCMEIYNDNINIMYRNEIEIQRLKEESKEKHHKTV